MANPDLHGAGVLITRPAHQCEALCERVREAGGRPIRLPVLEIAPPTDPSRLGALIDRLETFELAIFVSPNAVTRGLEAVRACRGELPPLKVATVGSASARAVERVLGRAPDFTPQERFDSEGLLALPALQAVAGWRVVIFRGEGGREHLAETLRARGATVEYAEVYRRALPDIDVAPLIRRWQAGEVDIVTATSSEGLHNLFELLGRPGRELLRTTPLVVVSERAVRLAAELGFGQPPILAANATDAALMDALAAWAAARYSGGG